VVLLGGGPGLLGNVLLALEVLDQAEDFLLGVVGLVGPRRGGRRHGRHQGEAEDDAPFRHRDAPRLENVLLQLSRKSLWQFSQALLSRKAAALTPLASSVIAAACSARAALSMSSM